MHTLYAKTAGQDGSTFTKTIHKTTYPTIDPARPELSQAGRTVVITGGSAGIGFAIAQGFAQAGAKHIIILGRRQNVLDEAVSQLHKEYPSVKIDGRQSDVANLDETDALWKSFENDGIFVDVLVLNAALVSAGSPILELGRDEIWSQYLVNFLVSLSTEAAHNFARASLWPAYSTTKNAGTMLLQRIANDTPAEKMQIINFHPGVVYTDVFKPFVPRDIYPFDDEKLGSHFAVWAASDEARFLHGRFVWAAWDIDELRTGEIKKNIDNNPEFLQVGIVGLQQ
ncbi:Short chain dehydrogenase citE [Colletotrichum siamense]|uniref:Short chain dehydrogenase citE n=1 Tax=Colletotrichum siamense TaxID=690259 RepID=UPI001872FD86|nr:Short chain dehydrogenase citE [Colletotrichum siamense]KAF5497599.1 Short chain dehydrogenase citE [Colletotrichum siamense]